MAHRRFCTGFPVDASWDDAIDTALARCPVKLYFVTRKYLSKFVYRKVPATGLLDFVNGGDVVRRELREAVGKRIFIRAETSLEQAIEEARAGLETGDIFRDCLRRICNKHCYMFDVRTTDGILPVQYGNMARALLTEIRSTMRAGDSTAMLPGERHVLALLDRDKQSSAVVAGEQQFAFAVSYEVAAKSSRLVPGGARYPASTNSLRSGTEPGSPTATCGVRTLATVFRLDE